MIFPIRYRNMMLRASKFPGVATNDEAFYSYCEVVMSSNAFISLDV